MQLILLVNLAYLHGMIHVMEGGTPKTTILARWFVISMVY